MADPNVRHQNIVNDDQKSLTRFDDYFNNMKNYFYSKLTNFKKIVSNNEVLIYEYKGPNQLFLSLKILLLNIINSFEKSNQILIKNIYALLLSQLKDMEHYNGTKFDVTTDMLIYKTCRYYEEEFVNMLKVSDESLYTDKLMENYSQKIKTVEKFVKNKVYVRFFKISTRNIDTLMQWANFYYLIRCGYLEELLTYMSSNSKLDKEMKIFYNLFKQVVEKQEIDSSEYYKLIDILKANDNEENIFKEACIVYITKVDYRDYRINPVLLETFDEYLWFNLRLISDDKNFKKLKSRNTSINYQSLKKIQTHVLENKNLFKNTNTYEPHFQVVKVSLIFLN